MGSARLIDTDTPFPEATGLSCSIDEIFLACEAGVGVLDLISSTKFGGCDILLGLRRAGSGKLSLLLLLTLALRDETSDGVDGMPKIVVLASARILGLLFSVILSTLTFLMKLWILSFALLIAVEASFTSCLKLRRCW